MPGEVRELTCGERSLQIGNDKSSKSMRLIQIIFLLFVIITPNVLYSEENDKFYKLAALTANFSISTRAKI